jgi:hypothetical protein
MPGEKDIYEAQILDSDEKPESEKREKSVDEADSQLLEQFNELGKQISSEKKPEKPFKTSVYSEDSSDEGNVDLSGQ